MVSCAPRLPPAVPGSGVRCGRACWARVSAVPSPSWLGCRGVYFAPIFFWVSLSRALWSLSPGSLSFRLGCWLFFFFVVCVCMFRCPFSPWAAVPDLVLPVLAGWSPCASLGFLSSVPSGGGVWLPLVVLAGGLVAVGCFHAPPPPPSVVFFLRGGGAACSSLCLPWAGARTGPLSVLSSGLLMAVAFCLAVPAPWVGWAMYTVGSAPLLAVLGPGSAGWAAAPGGCLWLCIRGLGLFVSFPLCGAGFNLLGGPPPLLPGALWPRVWPAVLVCGVLVRRLLGRAVACFG